MFNELPKIRALLEMTEVLRFMDEFSTYQSYSPKVLVIYIVKFFLRALSEYRDKSYHGPNGMHT